MSPARRTWAVILAAGEGTRLASLTRDAAGNSVPKQFCRLDGGSILVHAALRRARHIAPPAQVRAIAGRARHAPARRCFAPPTAGLGQGSRSEPGSKVRFVLRQHRQERYR